MQTVRIGGNRSSWGGRISAWAGVGAAILLAWFGSATLRGEEPAESFLEALRESGYHDAALLYLDRMDGSRFVSPRFQEELTYQRGVTLIEAAALVRDQRSRERMLNDAKASLEKFLKDQPGSSKRLFAQRQFVLLLRQWASMKVESARRTNDAELLKQAGTLYDDIYTASVAAAGELKTELAKLKPEYDPETERETLEYRDSLRGEYLLTLLRVAESLEEKAETEPADSDARTTLLTRASKAYEEMFTKYGGYLAGLRARLYQARCLAKLGDCDTALGQLTDDLLSQTDNRPPSRQLKTESLLLALDCWLQKADYATAIAQAAQWLDTMRPAESEESDWIRLRLLLARANKLYADQVAAKDPRDDIVKSAREEARRLARAVSRLPGEYQEEGRMLLAEIPGGVAAARIGTQEAAVTFEEARSRGTEAIAEMQSAEYFLANVPGRAQAETDEQVRKELENKLKTAQETVELKRREAKENLLLALTFADEGTPLEDLNLVRRLLAYLYYVEGEYYEAATIGEFIGRRFPGSSGARLGAQIALASYLKLYEANSGETREFETNHVVSLATYIVETWSGTPEAAEAINTLIPFLIRQGRLDKALAYVESIPPNTLERGSAELGVGEALWRSYLMGMQELREWEKEARDGGAAAAELQAKIAARQPELQDVRTKALGILESGVARMKEAGTVNPTVPRAVLSLAQIYVDSDQAPQALALLDDPAIGVLPMIQRTDAVMESAQLREQAYRVALSAMVSALSKAKTTQERTALVQRSREMIQLLREQAADSPESQKRLVDIFFSLARGLETQLKLLEKPADRRVLSEGFRTFLEQVRGEADDLRILKWVADSFVSLGNGLADDRQSSDAARDCFLSAVATYDQILQDPQKFSLTPELTRSLQFGKAVALRDAQRYEQAADLLQLVLGADNNRLEYQREAALTYQLWAAEPKEGIRYLTAVRGTQEDAQTRQQVVWGWSRIARITQRDKRYRNDFYEARYNQALCNYELALRLKKESDRTDYLKRARDSLVFTHRLYPTLGGPEWFGKYNTLLKKIQQSLGERSVGLTRPSR